MRELGRVKETVDLWRGLQRESAGLLELIQLAILEGDLTLQEEVQAELDNLKSNLARQEINLTLSGPYDDRASIITIYSGAGGTDSQDWAEMLYVMYLKWGETQRRPTQVLDLSYGEEAGLRSATLEIGGTNSYGYLTAEMGVHRLVRLSPYDPNHLRHLSLIHI